MARRKEKVSAYGRMWGQEDVKTLEKLIKLYERLNYLQDHFAGSLSGASAIWSQINEKTDIQNELKEMGIKLNEEEAKNVLVNWMENYNSDDYPEVIKLEDFN